MKRIIAAVLLADVAVSLEVSADRDRVSVGVLDQCSGAAGFTRAMLQ